MEDKHSKKTGKRGRVVWFKKMMMCFFLANQPREDDKVESSSSLPTRDHSANGYSARARRVQVQPTNTSTTEETELALRESGFLNYEEARALLGRLEYQKGNIGGACRVLEGIDIDSLIPNIKTALARRCEPSRQNSQSGPLQLSMHSVTLFFEAIYLKAKALKSLCRFEEAAQSCQVIVDTVISAIPEGLNGMFSSDCKLQDTLIQTVESLPALWKLAKQPQKAITSYRQVLHYGWDLDIATQTRIEKEFAIYLLNCGTEAIPPTLQFQAEGAYVPSSNTEEAIILLSLLLSKCFWSRIEWNLSIMDHLSFALSAVENVETLACHIEELLEGGIDRKEKALFCRGLGEDKACLNLLRNLLNDRENENPTLELLLGLKIYAEKDMNCCEEELNFPESSDRTIKRLGGDCVQRAGKASCLIGNLTSARSQSALSDSKRVQMQAVALDLLGDAENLTKERDPDIIYHLALENADQRKLDTALSYFKQLLKLEAGLSASGWILPARILSAKKRFSDAETIVNAALEQTGKWEHAVLLRTIAKLEIAQGNTRIAIETYNHLLAVLQAPKKINGFWNRHLEMENQTLETDTWNDLANIYTNLSKWDEAKACLSKLKALYPHSASRYHSKGLLYQAKGLDRKAQKSFWKALNSDPNHVPSLLSMTNILVHIGKESLPFAKSLVRQAIRVDRTNHSAWQTLGLIHRCEGQPSDAAKCFEAATLLKETAPVEPFR